MVDSSYPAFLNVWTLNSPRFPARVWLCVPSSTQNEHAFYLYVIISNWFSNAVTLRFYEPSLRSGSTCEIFRNIVSFYGEDLIALLQTTKLEGYRFSAFCYCLFNIFASTLRIWKPFAFQQPEDAPCSSDTEESTSQLYQLRTNYSQHSAVEVNSICGGNYWGTSVWISMLQVKYWS